jgi:hypothetical protein
VLPQKGYACRSTQPPSVSIAHFQADDRVLGTSILYYHSPCTKYIVANEAGGGAREGQGRYSTASQLARHTIRVMDRRDPWECQASEGAGVLNARSYEKPLGVSVAAAPDAMQGRAVVVVVEGPQAFFGPTSDLVVVLAGARQQQQEDESTMSVMHHALGDLCNCILHWHGHQRRGAVDEDGGDNHLRRIYPFLHLYLYTYMVTCTRTYKA